MTKPLIVLSSQLQNVSPMNVLHAKPLLIAVILTPPRFVTLQVTASPICRATCSIDSDCESRFASQCDGGRCAPCVIDSDCNSVPPFVYCYDGVCGNCDSSCADTNLYCDDHKCSTCRESDSAGCSRALPRCIQED